MNDLEDEILLLPVWETEYLNLAINANDQTRLDIVAEATDGNRIVGVMKLTPENVAQAEEFVEWHNEKANFANTKRSN